MQCGYKNGSDRLHLRLPYILTHIIDADSPLAPWREPGGLDADRNSEIVVVINAYMNVNTHNILRQRIYSIRSHLRYGYGFKPMIRHPFLARDQKARIKWQHFHDIQKAERMEKFPKEPNFQLQRKQVNPVGTGLAQAPESHAHHRSQISMRGYKTPAASPQEVERVGSGIESGFIQDGVDLDRYQANFTTSGDETVIDPSTKRKARMFQQYSMDTSDTGNSLPYPAALHPALPGKDKFREDDGADIEPAFLYNNDFTVQAMDLHRYSAAIGTSDSLPPTRGRPYIPIPTEFKEATALAQLERAQENPAVIEEPGQEIEPTDQPDASSQQAQASEDKAEQGKGEQILAGVHPMEAKEASTQDDGPIHFM